MQGLSPSTTAMAVNGGRGVTIVPLGTSAAEAAATPIAAPSRTTPQSTATPVSMPVRSDMQAQSRLTYMVNAEIKGYNSLANEDRKSVSELMFWAMSIKCTDGNYASPSYPRPRFWRVETLQSLDYLLIVGGWDELDLEELQKINRWDPQPEGCRNIIGIRVITAPENDPPHNHYMSISIRYRREEERRRRISTSSDYSESPRRISTSSDYSESSDTPLLGMRTQMGGASKKRSLLGNVVNWVAYGSSSSAVGTD